MLERTKIEYSPLGEALNNKANSRKDKTDKRVKTDKQDKNLFYNLQYSFAKFKDINDFKEISLGFMHKKLYEFHKKNY